MMHDSMQYDPIQGQGHEPLKVGKLESRPFSKAISSHIYNGGWQMTTDSEIGGQYLKLIGAAFLIFILVFSLSHHKACIRVYRVLIFGDYCEVL